MRIVVIMKSRYSYDRLRTELEKHKYIINKHIEGIGDIQECLQYWRPDIAIIDTKSPIYTEAKELFFRFSKDVVDFNSSFDEVIEEVHTYSAFYDSGEEEPIEIEKHERPDFSEYEEQLRPVEREKEVIIEIQKEIVEKEIEKISYTNITPKLLVVASLWNGAGSTFFSTNLAKAVAERGVLATYVEYPTITPYMFDYLNVSLRESEDKFQYMDLAKIIEKKVNIPRGKGWFYKGIKWVVNDPRLPTAKNWNFEKTLKLIYSMNSPIIIVDISIAWNNEEVKGLLHQADYIYLCIEPDVSKINCLADNRKESSFYEYLRNVEMEEGVPFELVVTKMNEGVKYKEWREVLPKKPLLELNYFPYPEIMKYSWESLFLYDSEKYKNELDEMMIPIIKSILPKRFHYKEEKQKKNLKSILNIFQKK